ncbi:hypothetical protein [Phenylobacterium deserti]|uniref:Uncharacterized protein n=1 Tax=Phenylobacterium deserti TaxID=1914756 RepID=A0A328AD53_9CAUL|nr:hypothetical protein [Phenylobacterium deserti]RAK52753.1 hypothetical protein DJ018_11230 [Phenylobacterium deserti]
MIGGLRDHAAQRRLRLQARVLAVIAVLLAGMCVWLARAWDREHRVAECWRDIAEGETPAEGSCGSTK